MISAASPSCLLSSWASVTLVDVEIGDEWIYRLKAFSPSERVRILDIEKRKQTTRVDIEFLNGEKSGQKQNVPGGRLQGAWSGVVQFDERMANWQRIGDVDLDDIEDWAVMEVFDLLIPEDVATHYDSFIRHGATVRNRAALEQLMRRDLEEIIQQVEWFQDGDVLQLSAAGTLLIAEYVCASDPAPILERVMAEETEIREYCKRGREFDAIDGSGKRRSLPEREYELYRRRQKPIHELLRSWCGHRSVTFVERLTAAEAEIRRLDILVAELIDAVKEHNKYTADDAFEQRHNTDRIRPEAVRPVVDRPLAPWEIPVREVRVRGRRWW